jgi:hypothetical protein
MSKIILTLTKDDAEKLGQIRKIEDDFSFVLPEEEELLIRKVLRYFSLSDKIDYRNYTTLFVDGALKIIPKG